MKEKEVLKDNKVPGIELIGEDVANPTLVSPNNEFSIQFYETRESLIDPETYRNFIVNTKSLFRHYIGYRHYKAFLMQLGLDRDQFMGNINSEMATIEMHHHPLTIEDIIILITEHTLNTYGKVTEFDVCELLADAHKGGQVGTIMLAKTTHQLYHNSNGDLYISPKMIIGNWVSLLERFNTGITVEIANKVIMFLQSAIDNDDKSDDNNLLEVRDRIIDWSNRNIQLFYK